jgi:hypothetical protein
VTLVIAGTALSFAWMIRRTMPAPPLPYAEPEPPQWLDRPDGGTQTDWRLAA